MSKLIQMPCADNTIIVEVETSEDEIIQVSKTGERLINRVQQSFDSVNSTLINSCTILTEGLRALAEKEATLETASIEFGFQFTAEGNIYLVKTAAESSIKVSLNLKLR